MVCNMADWVKFYCKDVFAHVIIHSYVDIHNITLFFKWSWWFFLHDTRKSASSLCFSFQTLFSQSQQTSWFFTLVRLRPHRAVSSCQTREVKLIHTSTPAHILLSKRHDTLLAERDSGDMGAHTAKQKQTLMTKWSPVPAWAAVKISFLNLSASRINNMSLHRSLWCRPPPYHCRWIQSQGGVLQLIGVQIL